MAVNWRWGSEIVTREGKISHACVAALSSFGLTVLD